MKKILVVDDTEAWRNFHKNTLEEIFTDKCEIFTADYAQDAINILYEQNHTPFDIIITDLQMEDNFTPQYAGEWLIEQIKTLSAYKNTRIIISSGCTNIRYIAEQLNVDYIPKRIACTDLKKYMEIVVGK